jgi:nitrogen fixation/metabolism regulation signal transduction histidine kinase
LIVVDNGPGFHGSLKKILEPLFTTKNFSTGLGLPSSRIFCCNMAEVLI